MRNIVLGCIVTVWGAAILLVKALGSTPSRGGAYGAGQSAALVFALIMIVVGIGAVRKGMRQRR
jgi:hypothetical protein